VRWLLLIVLGWLWLGLAQPLQAAKIDPFVKRYLQVAQPVELPYDASGQLRSFDAEQISAGKHLFETNCLNCHVAGETLPDPRITLSLQDLSQATPPRDTISGLVAYLRQPMTYDGSEPTLSCREIPEDWLSQAQVENLAAFLLRTAQKAPGWGTGALN
jgi:photosystem II cytochrome c550